MPNCMATTSTRGGPVMEFERVPRLPAHHLHGATLQDGPRLWTVAAFGGEVSLCATVGGVQAGFVIQAEHAFKL